MSATTWPFITEGEAGVPLLNGTGIKVIEVALDHMAYGWDAPQISRQYPNLTLPQIHAAPGYCYDHQEACDREIAMRRQRADDFLKRAGHREFAGEAASNEGGAVQLITESR